MYVTAEPDRVGIDVGFLDATAGFHSYQLSSDEQLGAMFRGQGVQLLPGSYRYGLGYAASIPVDHAVAEGETVTIVFDRGRDERITIPASAPAEFALEMPASTPATQPAILRWSPTAMDPMSWWAGTLCSGVESNDGPIRTDTGELDIPPGVLAPATLATPCTVDLELHRTRSATPDTGLRYADVSLTRRHTTTVEITP